MVRPVLCRVWIPWSDPGTVRPRQYVRGMTKVGSLRSPLEGALVGRLLERPASTARLPVELLSREQKAAELQRVQARKAMDATYEAELVMGLADETPDTLDPPPDHPGASRGSWAPDAELPGVSEFFVPELAVVLNCGRGTASHLAHRAWVHRGHLPATWAAMADGVLDESRAKVLADVLAHTSPRIARQIEARLLPEATQLSTGRLRRRALALLLELDADAVDERREDAQRQADVRSHSSHLEGMSTLAADLPTPVSAACLDVVDRLAGMLEADGDPARSGSCAPRAGRPDPPPLGHQPAGGHRPPGRHRPPPLAHRRGGRAGVGERAADHRGPPPATACPAGCPRPACARGWVDDRRAHRRRRAPARHGRLGAAREAGSARLPRTPRRRLWLSGAGQAGGHRRLPAHGRPARVRAHP